MSSKGSYTSAGTFPVKLLGQREMLESGNIRPVHPQVLLTNRCQLSCPYCSCMKHRKCDADSFFPSPLMERYLGELSVLGARAVTLTGGGEPLLHPEFGKVVGRARAAGLEVGLVTNGEAFGDWPAGLFMGMTWIRVSYDRYRKQLPSPPRGLTNVAYSYVYTHGADKDPALQQLIRMAEKGALTHLRIVSDILDEDAADNFSSPLWERILPDNVILQNRSRYEKGAKACWLSLLKPVIDVDGLVYPCCGVQYAIRGEERKLPSRMCMGGLDEYVAEHVLPQVPFDGSVCGRCYYGEYNRFLAGVKGLRDVDHLRFV